MKEKDYYSSDVIAILKIIDIDILSALRCLKHDNVELAKDVLQKQNDFILEIISIIENRKPE